MPWSSSHDVPFRAHLEATLAAVDAALAATGHDALVIAAGEERLAFQDDQAYPFRLNPWFAWLVPAPPAPGSLLVLRPGHRPRLLFVAPDDYWHSPPEVPTASWTEAFEIQACTSGAAALAAVQHAGRTAWIGEPAVPRADWTANPRLLLEHLEQARCRKTAHELDCLREASRIGVMGHRAAEEAFRGGASEFDIHLAFLAAVRQTDAQLPYGSIVALNDHGATLHYQLRDRLPPRRSLSLLIDAGASCRGYGCDITRTYAAAPGLFAELVDGMHALQQDLCEAVAPGVAWPDLHLQAHRRVAALLRDAGVLNMAADAAVESGVSGVFLPHGLGHLLGLQVHDVGGFQAAPGTAPLERPAGHPALRLTRPLVPHMVVTVEPGLYFIDSLLARLRAGPHAAAVNWTLVENLRAYGGIRIEDNVVVTADGHENVTRTAFADVA